MPPDPPRIGGIIPNPCSKPSSYATANACIHCIRSCSDHNIDESYTKFRQASEIHVTVLDMTPVLYYQTSHGSDMYMYNALWLFKFIITADHVKVVWLVS